MYARLALPAVLAVALAACSKDDPARPALLIDAAGMDAPQVPLVEAGIDGDATTIPGGDSALCVVPDVTSLPAPPWIVPTPLGQRVCTQAQITRYLFDCLSATATPESCAPYKAQDGSADARCGGCIVATSASAAGPVILVDGKARINNAGCVATAQGNPQTGSACAHAVQLVDDCASKVCSKACGTDTPACVSAASTGACKRYADDVSLCTADAGAAVDACFGGKTFPQHYGAVVALWCGGAPADAGASDAAGD